MPPVTPRTMRLPGQAAAVAWRLSPNRSYRRRIYRSLSHRTSMAIRIRPREQPGAGRQARREPGGISAHVRFVRAAQAARARRDGAAVPGADGRRRGWRSCAWSSRCRPRSSRPRTRAGSATRRWSRCGCRTGTWSRVFDAGLQGDRIFLAMDYVDGRDLHAVWNRCAERRVPFPVDIAVYIVKELCRGLAYAHAFEDLKLVHRDVSPGNVLLSFSGEVKLTDFGLATSSLKIEKTAPGIIYGKLSYLAPEQARRRAAGRAHRPLRGGDPAVGAADRAAAVPGRARSGGRIRRRRERRRARPRAQSARRRRRRRCHRACRPSWSAS